MELLEHEERALGDYRLLYDYQITDGRIRRMELCICNLETQDEEQMYIYGHISLENQAFSCCVAQEADPRPLVEAFCLFLQEKQPSV